MEAYQLPKGSLRVNILLCESLLLIGYKEFSCYKDKRERERLQGVGELDAL